jgi:hypothetical protein
MLLDNVYSYLALPYLCGTDLCTNVKAIIFFAISVQCAYVILFWTNGICWILVLLVFYKKGSFLFKLSNMD